MDIFWRTFYKALPLGYRLKYMDFSFNRSCPWCPEEQQTVNHFTIHCKASKEVWNKAYTFLQTGIQETPPLQLMKYLILATLEVDIPHKQSFGCILTLYTKFGVAIQLQDREIIYIQLQ